MQLGNDSLTRRLIPSVLGKRQQQHSPVTQRSDVRLGTGVDGSERHGNIGGRVAHDYGVTAGVTPGLESSMLFRVATLQFTLSR